MQICPNCKKVIKYIPISYDKVVVCDSVITTIYTEHGRCIDGYVLHKCKKSENDSRESSKPDNS